MSAIGLSAWATEAGVSEHAVRVAESALATERAKREHVVIALSGAHAYGFPSPDSDLDLKASHIERTEHFLGLARAVSKAERLEVIDGVEIDYSSNEIGAVVAGVIGGNGNYLERIDGKLLVETNELHSELAALSKQALSKRYFRHYAGFANSQRKDFENATEPTAKKLLYVLRTALTGVHLLRSGELRVPLAANSTEYGFDRFGVAELIATKRRGERVTLEPSAREHWKEALDKLFRELEGARDDSALPEEAQNAVALEDWLIRARLERLSRDE